ncbi:Putative sperm motility kinase W [Lemmus lemmus]
MPVAIKVVENLKKHLHLVLSEIAALEAMQHPHIIRLYQVLTTTKYCYIITEYAPGGNLYQLIQEEGRVQEEQAQIIFGQLVSAVKCCHDHDIVHRDLKPQNILLDAKGNVKLGDFGLAIRCRAGTVLQGRCGTKCYNAPELVLREGYDGRKADVWSLGVLLYFVTTGHHPFSGSTLKETEKSITNGMYDIPARISGQLENLIHRILTVAPEKRPSIEDIQHHPWVKNPEGVCSTRLEEEMPLPPGPDSNMGKSCLPQIIGCFRRLCRRIRACLSRLCFFFLRAPDPRTRRVFNNKVASLKESGGRPSEE